MRCVATRSSLLFALRQRDSAQAASADDPVALLADRLEEAVCIAATCGGLKVGKGWREVVVDDAVIWEHVSGERTAHFPLKLDEKPPRDTSASTAALLGVAVSKKRRSTTRDRLTVRWASVGCGGDGRVAW